ncbi:MAG: YheT family hydrolase [Desulfovibrionales bacterium]
MPVIASFYRSRFCLGSGHVQTMYPALFRKSAHVNYRRERIATPDGDFLDLDWLRAGFPGLAVISHGLEGSSRGKYVLGMAHMLHSHGWDVLALNFRGCSGEPNRTLRLYHSGVTDDLHTALRHGLRVGRYHKAVLVGFSMGGNQTLKYLGEDPDKVPAEVGSAIVFSVPCDLEGAALAMGRYENRVYMHKFLRTLRRKVEEKDQRFPGILDLRGIASLRTFQEFDERYTAPLHGFSSALDYWRTCSANRFLEAIDRPTLLVNALNDPFLSPTCFPLAQAAASPYLHLECPRSGGHVGFLGLDRKGVSWAEKRTVQFLTSGT